MINNKDTVSFFENGTAEQFEYCFKVYPQALKLKAEKRCTKPQELIRLDQWYQNELPKLIKARGKDAHMIYDELVQTMEWKQLRGKFYPQLSYLVKVNTPHAVIQETKKAFRKLPNLEEAITALSNLKGVCTTMASAVLAAAAPDSAPFMADECLMPILYIYEGIDYTIKEYLNFVQHIQMTVQRLNAEAGGGGGGGGGGGQQWWSPHRVELALWAHYVANDLNPELLNQMPSGSYKNLTANGSAVKTMVESVSSDSIDADDGMGKAELAVVKREDTNDNDDTTTNESLTAARGGETNNNDTDSETDNENNTNPIPSILVNSSVSAAGVLQDGDSNFVSNESTSQEDIGNANIIIDEENTRQTTIAARSTTNTPLAADYEINMEATPKFSNTRGCKRHSSIHPILSNPKVLEGNKIAFNMQWRNPSKKKHKFWKGNGIAEFMLDENRAVFFDENGKYMGKNEKFKISEVKEGLHMRIYGKEVELMEQIQNQAEYWIARKTLVDNRGWGKEEWEPPEEPQKKNK